MNRRYAVYTQETECQDCYKCLRCCPVKAIAVTGAHAAIDPDLCVACGNCVSVCPAKAKKIRNDVERTKHILNIKDKVFVALAPSWSNEFTDASPKQIIAALKKLGFEGVAEVALGAQDVSAWTAQILKENKKIWLSSACPASVDYIRNYMPELAGNITPFASPAVSTAAILKEDYGSECGVIFIGPCIAKKTEADASGGIMDLSLTFSELRSWFEEENIAPASLEVSNERFEPEGGANGRLYPIEGGMIETLRPHLGEDDETRMFCVSGLSKLERTLKGITEQGIEGNVFIECLACDGGCLGGPGMVEGKAGLDSLLEVYTEVGNSKSCRATSKKVVAKEYLPAGISREELTEAEIEEVMRGIGKNSIDDELNCGGCGYDTCRDFARALAAKRAEPQMCVSYMRRLAQQKANALLRCMPSGVVIVNEQMQIIECNRSFASLFGEDIESAFDAFPGLADASIEKFGSFTELFRVAIRNGQDISQEHFECGDRLFNINVFTIEPGKTVGAVIQDVTLQEFKREQIAKKAKEVIQKNIATVQEIACLLGEHVTETEILLSTIADDYAATELSEQDQGDN